MTGYKSFVLGEMKDGVRVEGTVSAASCHNYYVHVKAHHVASSSWLDVDLNTSMGLPFLNVKESPVLTWGLSESEAINHARHYSFRTQKIRGSDASQLHHRVKSEYLSAGRWYIGVCNSRSLSIGGVSEKDNGNLIESTKYQAVVR